MKPRTAILPLLFLSIVACTGGVAQRASLPGIETVTFESPVFRGDSVRSFELSRDCDEYKLTEADVRAYFANASEITFEESSAASDAGKASKCVAQGNITFSDGSLGFWQIDKARYGSLSFQQGSDKGQISFYCDTCEGKQFYASSDELAKLRPALQSVEVVENKGNTFNHKGEPDIPSASCKRDFKLTETEILSFFANADPWSFMDMEDSRDLEESRCHINGNATLKNGPKATWEINRFGVGFLSLQDETLWYYCAACKAGQWPR